MKMYKKVCIFKTTSILLVSVRLNCERVFEKVMNENDRFCYFLLQKTTLTTSQAVHRSKHIEKPQTNKNHITLEEYAPQLLARRRIPYRHSSRQWM